MPNAINTNLSYFRIRKVIGILGLSLPLLTPLIAWEYLSSISHSYYTESGTLFTSVLSLMGVFLISYRGYEPEGELLSDNIITWIGGLLVLVVAAVPTGLEVCCNFHIPRPTPFCVCADDLLDSIHFFSAAGFFLCMGYMSIFRFTKGKGTPSNDKKFRNHIYRICGIIMWFTLLVAAVVVFGFEPKIQNTHFVFWIEVVLLVSFGISWLVKGKALADLGFQKDDTYSG